MSAKHGLRHAFSEWRGRLQKSRPLLGQSPNDVTELLAEKGGHERSILSQFKGNVRFTGGKPVLDCGLILVAFTNRSGSNLLCDYLGQCPRVAATGEHLTAVLPLCPDERIDIADILSVRHGQQA